MALLEALTISLIALIIAPSQMFYFDITSKVAVLLAGTAALLILAARRREAPAGPRVFWLLLLVNAASLALSTVFSTYRNLSLYGSTWRSYGLLVQLTAMLFAWLVAWDCTGRPDRARIVLRGISLAGAMSALYGIAQYAGVDPLLSREYYRVGEGVWSIVRPPGTLGYASYFATWLLMTIFLSLALAGMETNRWWRIAAYASAAVSLAAMVLTGTRAALVGLAAGALVWIVWNGFRVSKRTVIAAAVALACAVAFYYSPPGQQMRSRSRWFVEDPWGGARLLLWRDSVSMALQRPLAGFGPEVFLGEFPHYESKELARAFPDFVHESPHNILLDGLVSQGLPGLAALCALCAAGFLAAWRLKAKQRALAALLAAALAAGLISQQFTAFTVPTAVLFLVTIALAAGLATEAGPPRRTPVFAAIAPFAVLALAYLGARIAIADHSLAVTRQFLDTQNLKAATKQYENYWFWHLPGTNADLWYSRNWMAIARKTPDLAVLQQAITIAGQAADRATIDPEEPFAAWYNLAQIAALRDDYDGAEADLRRTVTEHPYWFKPHWMLAQQLRLVSKLDDAEKEALIAVDLDNGHDPEVIQTLQDIRARRQQQPNP